MKPKGRKVPGSRSHATSRSSASAGSRTPRPCPIVGIGASAGGLEAFTRLLKCLPADTGLGIVLVQHLDPEHDSALTQILARATTMPVREVTNNLRIEPNHVYVIPPNTILSIKRGVLKLQPRVPTRTPARSIDSFFESLASDQHERAIGVILSGTASDGTLGLEAIKAEGGITFAQDDSAKYNSMPRSAVGAGCVDFELSPEAIAMELAGIAQHPLVSGRSLAPFVHPSETTESNPTADGSPLPARGGGRLAGKARGGNGMGPPSRTQLENAAVRENEDYQKILLQLRNHSGVDFSLYKPATIHRRITRRTILNKHHNLEEYAGFLRGNTKELDALYSDALIGVTSFFRNADAFDVLRHKVFPKLLQQPGNDPVRIWVLGCSTGQEAYSIAIAFTEAAGKARRQRRLQVFATDLNEANLNKARHGLYAKSLAQDVSPERLRRFFVEEEGGYRIVKPLREQVVFARQNLISDPPFSRMDLISCRNLMIYLEPSLQKKALPTFHYALKPEGFLFLGASESIGAFTDLFEPMDKKQKIFSKKTASPTVLQLPVRREFGKRTPSDPSSRPLPLNRKNAGVALDGFHGELNAEREADRVTVNQFAPPGVLVNADLQILQFRGATGDYLEPPSGKASFDLLKMARDGLMLPLRAMIQKAKKENKTVRRENVPFVRNGKAAGVDVEVVPLKNLKDVCFLVLFTGAGKRSRAGANAPIPEHMEEREVKPRAVSPRQESVQIARLERDLAEARDYLQS
ncbi:MAG: chemotaxis protein CheB, partial [Lacunisphaera sp.]